MALPRFKKTIKNETLRPYALSSESPWVTLMYRFDEAEPWQNALTSSFVVLPSNRDDVRMDVLHSFNIQVDLNAVRADGIDPAHVDLVVLTRDGFAKKVVKFYQKPLSDQADTILNVPRNALESTSLAARIDFHIMLAARAQLKLPNRTIRRGGRLAAHTLSVSAEKKGHSFNFSKTTPAEFLAKGLPSSTTFQLDVYSTLDLVEACDDVSQVLSVLVHEDAWSTLQEIKSGDRIGEALGAMFLADVIFAVLLAAKDALKAESRRLDDGSVTKRLLAWLAEKSAQTPEDLEQLLVEDDGMPRLQAAIQDTLRLTHSVHRVRLGEAD